MNYNKEDIMKQAIEFFQKYWWLIALAAIFIFSYYIRAINNVPDRLLSFDPIFQYRFTKYFVDWGFLPEWDELTYYVGRANYLPPFMYYLTGIFFWLLKGFGLSLFTVAAYASAIYGAAITIPAFLLGRELSNKYGGLLAAVLVGTAPQILVRTFGASYDTDQLVLFFILLTIYLGVYALRKRTVGSFCIALTGFAMFMLAWQMFWYSLFIIVASVVFYFILGSLLGNEGKKILSERIALSLKKIKTQIIILIGLLAGILSIGYLAKLDIIYTLLGLFVFAQKAETWIVNISIAELQPINLGDLGTWILAMGRFAIGDQLIDILLFLTFLALIVFGLISTFKKDLFKKSVILALFVFSVYTITKGIRFTEFSSGLFLILVAVGFGYFAEFCKRNEFLKIFALGLGLSIAFVGISLGLQVGPQLGPDINSNWEAAWGFLRTQTPEMSLIGTWWDPGHMITGLAERRVAADGAHCDTSCMYTINDRITDLGKIFATNDENVSLQLIRKYQGTSPKAYWIASDDLIGKFQWLQYFGIGCDARVEQRCPLYYQLPMQQASYNIDGSVSIRYYGNVIVLSGNVPLPILIQGRNAALFEEMWYYEGGAVKKIRLDPSQMYEQMSAIAKQLGYKFSNQTIGLTVWVPQHYSYLVLIPPNQRENVFTRMFFLEGEGLSNFRMVFRNEQVKIYEVIGL